MLQSIGFAFSPLREVDDAACLMEAAALIPPAVPNRAKRLVDYLRSKLRTLAVNPLEILTLFTKMRGGVEGGARFDEVVSCLPPRDGQFIVTDRTACVVCGGALEQAVGTKGREFAAKPELFTQDGVVHDCTLLWFRCGCCKARHYYSYAVGGDILPDGCVQVYPDWNGLRYIHITEHQVFEARVLLRYRDQCLHSHTSLQAFAKEYSSLSICHPLASWEAWAKRLGHVWRAFELVTWLQEIEPEDATPLRLPLSDNAALDATLLSYAPRFLTFLVTRWGKNHVLVCLSPGRCNCFILDGHMKCVRSVCANKWARLLHMGTLGTAVLGCTHTPLRGSIYCRTCHDASAVRGAAGETSAGSYDIQPEAAEEAPSEEAVSAAEVRRNHNVYLVEDVLDAERQTVVRGGEAHRTCARANKLRLLVSWVGYPPEENSWVCECNAGKEVVRSWKEKKAADAAAKKAARTAGKAAAENAKSATGDFNLSAEERREITEQTDCNCLKDQHATGRAATAGILALVASCGLILAASEIYGSESLTQVHLFLYQVFIEAGLPPPAVLAYDDGCHLSMYLLNRLGRFGRSVLAVYLLVYHKVKIVVDKFHWKNHTGIFCKRNNDPYECPDIVGRRTERAEETFSWLARSKHLYRSMNEARFLFTMLRMMHHRNVFLSASSRAPPCEPCGDL